ncbi:MAG: RNA 2',3'-cyclic phosphodiesterase [Phycisphaerales bacterium]|nr:RNA 2',3'-cyclic phosphodiesterase [Phycisphaerales bacterium]
MSVLRLFIAAYPPRDVADVLIASARSLGLPLLKTSPADQVHITLLFIGDTDERQLGDVSESMSRAASGVSVIRLSIERLIGLPERGECRLIAAEASAPPTLLELQKRLAQRLVRTKPERERGFLPHLTLGRFPGSGARPRDRVWPAPSVEFLVTDIRLMASVLKPTGAEHREQARACLASPE